MQHCALAAAACAEHCRPSVVAPCNPCRLHAEGLDSERWAAAAQNYIAGEAGKQTLDQAVAAIKAAKQEITDREARRTRITERFTQQGLQEFLPQQNAWGGWAGGEEVGGGQPACRLPADAGPAVHAGWCVSSAAECAAERTAMLWLLM